MKHCFHATGVVYTVHPPMYGVICCHCGMESRQKPHRVWPKEHGKHIPEQYEYRVDSYLLEDECEGDD